jgi:uncharacterized protein (TIGR02680 family)
MPNRWTLTRAGITNVYQYGDEVLHFAGGRLLLRGVNGSGKSTAMNMLLPFLLEADTRRIDAAGEQAGVLRSWMLSGRDEPQPVGYLWIEFGRRRDGHTGVDHAGDQDDLPHHDDSSGAVDPEPDEFVVLGCGIRANRSTDRVTTWWFVTDRRPHVDLALVQAKTPLSTDALRSELGADAVFTADQRAAYRAAVRNRLYGGADLEQHLRLLHVVRNPRVGDRIDLDLPGYLEDALPQLSEAALDDAAQPLEDLEEHRRNVESLSRTAATLDALEAVYRDYGRTELRRRADDALELVSQHGTASREESAIRRRRLAAEAERDAASAAIERHEADERRLRREIETLQSRDAYKDGADLTDLRAYVASLTQQVEDAGAQVERRTRRRADAADAVRHAASEADADARAVHDRLADLHRLSAHACLAERPPDVPAVAMRPGRDDVAEVPAAPLDLTGTRQRLGLLRAAGQARRADIREVREACAAVERALTSVALAEERHARALEDRQVADQRAVELRAARDDAVDAWRARLADWCGRVAEHLTTHTIESVTDVDLDAPGLADRHDVVRASLRAWVQRAVDVHAHDLATVRARLVELRRDAADAGARLAELSARTLPDPPRTGWQGERTQPCLAELVDFRADVAPPRRAAIEAALEAAGLLAAEVRAEGLVLADGQLVARGGKPAPRPLAALLHVAEAPDPSAGAVRELLDAISTDPDDLDSPDEVTVVTDDGRFRVGVLRGRLHKDVAEHIGVTARRAQLERLRAAARAELDAATAAVEHAEADESRIAAASGAAASLRDSLPPATAVTEATLRVEQADLRVADAAEAVDARLAELRAAEAAHAALADAMRRTAAGHGLPHDAAGLDEVERSARELGSGCDLLDHALGAFDRSVQRWMQRTSDWEHAIDDADAADAALRAAQRALEPIAVKLATLEDTVGAEYDEIVRTIAVSERDLKVTATARSEAVRRRLEAHGTVERLAAEERAAAAERRDAERRCVSMLAHLRAALAVPGLLASAASAATPLARDGAAGATGAPTEAGTPDAGTPDADREVELPAVDESPHGLSVLANALQAVIPAPERGPTNAESVRQSLRQRRDALGAGWDAEDHQADESLPLRIEVTGTLVRTRSLRDAAQRVRTELRSLSGLLSAKQDQALRNLLQGLIAREVAEKLHAARELVGLMNRRLDSVTTSHGIGVSLRWQRRDDLDESTVSTIALLSKLPDLRTSDEDATLIAALNERITTARRDEPDAPYRELIAKVLDYRAWHRMTIVLHRPGRDDERLTRRTALSEGEKKMVSYLPLFAAVAASCDALAERAPDAPRFVLLDDAFAKVSEDNHPKLFGLLVELDLDFIATSERLWGTHATVPSLAITEVLRDADLGVIVLEHYRWDGRARAQVS